MQQIQFTSNHHQQRDEVVLAKGSLSRNPESGSVFKLEQSTKPFCLEQDTKSLNSTSRSDIEKVIKEGLKLPTTAEPSSIVDDNSYSVKTQEMIDSKYLVSKYDNFFKDQEQRIRTLEEQLCELVKEKQNLRKEFEELKELLNKQGEHLIYEPHPFHKFQTAIEDDFLEIYGDAIYNSDTEEHENNLDATTLEYVPESPPRKKRKISIFVGRTRSMKHKNEKSIGGEKKNAMKRKLDLSTSCAPDNYKLPDILGSLDPSNLVIWDNQTYALSKAFPEKNRLQVMKERYETEKKIPAYILCDGEDLRRLKLMNSNVANHTKQLSLYTLAFVSYYIENESY